MSCQHRLNTNLRINKKIMRRLYMIMIIWIATDPTAESDYIKRTRWLVGVQNSEHFSPTVWLKQLHSNCMLYSLHKGTCQKPFSGFCPLRGGWGYPPFPLRVFGQDDFPLRGGGVPPNSAKENSAKKADFFGPKTPCFASFHAFLALFWTIIWPFWPIFNLI